MAAFFVRDARPAEAQETTLWSTTLTIAKEDVSGLNHIVTGCLVTSVTAAHRCSNALVDRTFTLAGNSYEVQLLAIPTGNQNFEIEFTAGSPAISASVFQGLTFVFGTQRFPFSSGTVPSDRKIRWALTADQQTNWFPTLTDGSTVSVSLVRPAATPTPTPTPTETPPAVVIDPTQRSWPLTAIADESASEWWFPIGRGACDMKDEERPWTWDRWTPPTADQCGWLSIHDVRSGLDDPVDQLAFSVYTALIASPDIGGRAGVDRPRGPSVKLAVWAVYPEQHYNRYNWTRRLKGDAPLTVCLPGDEGQSIHAYDEAENEWVELESVEAERDGHICGLYRHDLGLIVVSSD